MQSHPAANMCKLEHTVPSRSVESEPENVLNALSPGRCSRWILPEELETPDRPTSSGLQSPVGAPVQLGPSPHVNTVILVHVVYLQLNGEIYMLEREEECELFGDVPVGHEAGIMGHPFEGAEHQDELDQAAALHATDSIQSIAANLTGARCVNGNLMRRRRAEEETPSTACRPNVVNAPGGALGRGLQDLVHLEATVH